MDIEKDPFEGIMVFELSTLKLADEITAIKDFQEKRNEQKIERS